MKLKKYEKNPIIAPNPANAWENLVTCNPGVIYDDGRFYMLYRAAGDDKEHVIRLGLAVSENGFDFRRVGDSPRKSLVTNCNSIISKNYLRLLVDSNEANYLLKVIH